ncbi:MAG: hypothetical protein RLZZ175_656 [Bacteroidota bacterium]
MTTDVVQLLTSAIKVTPTEGQKRFFHLFKNFLASTKSRPTILLKGYAGTGKTTLVGAVVSTATAINYKVVMLAPTGRAAKVMSNYSKRTAFTIHKYIYQRVEDSFTGNQYFMAQQNKAVNTIYIVDEASMIGTDNEMGANLLQDLIFFVFAHESNRLILVGDTAQLPPVGQTLSPALDRHTLERLNLHLYEIELTEVMRQQAHSGILANATNLRQQLNKENGEIKFQTRGYPDFYKMGTDKLHEGLEYAYKKFGEEDTILITRSNKSAVAFNKYIRSQIRWAEEEIETSDLLMVVKNNYAALPEDSPLGFIANGDTIKVRKVRKIEEMYGLRFANIEFSLIDYPNHTNVECKIILDTLHQETPSLSIEQYRKLYNDVAAEYADIPNKQERTQAIRKDSYLNALQVKYAYALTCHKSQGGQWGAVFVEQGYLTDEMMKDSAYFRWLYTAITRASTQLFLVNFDEQFFIPQSNG